MTWRKDDTTVDEFDIENEDKGEEEYENSWTGVNQLTQTKHIVKLSNNQYLHTTTTSEGS